MMHNVPSQLLQSSKRRRCTCIPFVSTYVRYTPSLDKVFHKQWRNINEDPRFYSLLPNAPFTRYSNDRMLRSLLCAKGRKFDTQQYQPNLQLSPGGELNL